jgi:hypothetical protein
LPARSCSSHPTWPATSLESRWTSTAGSIWTESRGSKAMAVLSAPAIDLHVRKNSDNVQACFHSCDRIAPWSSRQDLRRWQRPRLPFKFPVALAACRILPL